VEFAAPAKARPITSRFSRKLFARIAIFALLFAVVSFSTAAKNSCYYSQSHPVHYLSISSKMKVVHAAPVFDHAPLRIVAKVVLPQPQKESARTDRPDVPPTPQISVRVSLQHRSPPISIA
jgi:hypothetical protein